MTRALIRDLPLAAAAGLALGVLLATTAPAGTAPADLTAPIPICEDIDAALALTPAAFTGLHPDAFVQFRRMLDDLCGDPVAMWRERGLDDADLLAAVFNGSRVPAPVPLPPSGWLLLTMLSAAVTGALVARRIKRCAKF